MKPFVIACLALVAGAGWTAAAAAQDPVTITFTGSGGVLQDIESKYFLDPFMKLHPEIKVLQDSPNNYAKLRAMVESGNVTWDVVEGGGYFGLAPEQTALLEKIDCTIVPCAHLQPDKYVTTGYRAGELTSATILAYRSDKFPPGAGPQSWTDFFDVKKFPGGRSVLKIPANVGSTGLFEAALLADGVDPAKVYPIDVPRALARIETIREQIVWAADNQSCAERIATGEALMGICYANRMYNFFKNGAPVAVQWKASVHQGGYLFVPKGTRHLKEAMELVAYITGDEHGADVTPYTPNGPANEIAARKSSPVTADWNPSAHPDEGITMNDKWWAENSPAVIKAWTEWQLKSQ